MLRRFDGVMFDMDNTLLASKIDFKRMKSECLQILQEEQIVGWETLGEHATASEMIDLAKKREKHDIVKRMFSVVEAIEREGMKGATLEPRASEVIKHLAKEKTLVIVTNNATSAARYALERLKIAHYFTDIYGRDKMDAMKPAPQSILSVLRKYPDIVEEKWVMIGDSWIDGRAAEGAKVQYICYNGSKQLHHEKQVPVLKFITSLQQLI